MHTQTFILDFSTNIDLYSLNIPKEFIDFILQWQNNEENMLFKTSGTTGKSKEILAPKKHLKTSVLMTQEYFGYQKGDSALLPLSLDFVAGKMMLIRAMVSGLKLTVCPPNDLSILEKESFDFAPLVPLQVEKYFDFIHKIKQLLIGGGSIHQSLEKKLKNLNNRCFHSFGMTETYSHFAIRDLQKTDVYQTLNGVEISKTPDNKMCISVPKMEIRNLITNDHIELKNEGFIWLGRSDFMIKTGGVLIHPEYIENLIKTQGILKDEFIITALPDAILENKIVILIESEPKDLSRSIFNFLPKYHHPKELWFCNKLPRTKASGKIQRNLIDWNICSQKNWK
ncbi:MAG: AMP-binding protein [Flavobacteriales bacterium]|jgi:O-succinylbenzoic acid--CoA ligase|nr:AMP-binding protein [Flavobacteriales bacterium]